MANMNYFSDTVNSIVRSGDFNDKGHGNIPFTDAQKKNVPDYAKNYTFKSTQERDKKYSQLQGKGGGKKDTKTQDNKVSDLNFIKGNSDLVKLSGDEVVSSANAFNDLIGTDAHIIGKGGKPRKVKESGYSLLRDYHKSGVQSAIAQRNYTTDSYNRQNLLDESSANVKMAEDRVKQAKSNLEQTTTNVQNEKANRKLKYQKDVTDRGHLGAINKVFEKESNSLFDVIDTLDATKGRLDKRLFGDSTVGKTAKSKKAVDKILTSTSDVEESTSKALKAGNLLSKEQYEGLTDEQRKLYDKAAKSDEDARTTRRARSIRSAVQTTGDVFGAAKDTISAKSRANTLAERGLVGEKRRDARIAYALGDRSLGTKLAAGKSLGSKNAFTRFVGKFPAWVTYGRRENANRKNYAKQLAYTGGFSEGETGIVLGLLMSHDFSEDISLSGEGWQYQEYPVLDKLLNDDKYEKMDQKILESGQFSELDEVDSTPAEVPAVLSSDIAQHTQTSQLEEVTVENILNKNYYEASPLEKKFQEMMARGFSEEEKVRTYEDVLQSISDGADLMRRM